MTKQVCMHVKQTSCIQTATERFIYVLLVILKPLQSFVCYTRLLERQGPLVKRISTLTKSLVESLLS